MWALIEWPWDEPKQAYDQTIQIFESKDTNKTGLRPGFHFCKNESFIRLAEVPDVSLTESHLQINESIRRFQKWIMITFVANIQRLMFQFLNMNLHKLLNRVTYPI